jgi:glutathione S-transferase
MLAGKVIVATSAKDVPLAPVDGAPTVVYWNIVGLAMPLRMALALAGGNYADVRIDAAGPKGREPWTEAKPNLPMSFPNLPYYLDSKVALSQSDAILRYLGRQHNLMGDAGQEHVVDQALDELKDLEGVLAMHSYRSGVDHLAEWYAGSVGSIVAKWSKFMSEKDFVTGKTMSVADLKLYAYFVKLVEVQKQLGNNDTLADLHWDGFVDQHMKRMEQVPRLKEYLASELHQRRPLNNPGAMFNN